MQAFDSISRRIGVKNKSVVSSPQIHTTMLKLTVKASGVTNLTDARYFAARECQWLGFNMEPGNEQFIEPQQLMAIAGWVDGVKIVGEFGQQSVEEIKHLIENIPLDAVQLNMLTPPETLVALREHYVIQEVVADDYSQPEALQSFIFQSAPFVQAYLLNFAVNNLDWQWLKDHPALLDFTRRICSQYDTFVAIHCKDDDLDELLREIKPFGLAVTGGAEEKVGYKSFDDLDPIFDHLEVLD